jgi:hypothetical protein
VKKTIALGLALALSASLPAFAGNVTHTVYNTTHTCAWVTVDTANMMSPWRNDAFHYVKPGESYPFKVEARPELKVRAEPTKNADCSGGKIADVDTVQKRGIDDISAAQNFKITFSGGKFHVEGGKP